mgnify:CR=1 FL=1|tara:strand:+ start:1441 stop:1737 length:297 start_codon:yes stop_codon:yes gene_type:complete
MATKHYNIDHTRTVELLAPGDNVVVKSISLANINSSNDITVDLFIQKSLVGKFYFFKGLVIPKTLSLIYETSFSNKANEFGLYIKCAGTSPTLDIIIN